MGIPKAVDEFAESLGKPIRSLYWLVALIASA